MNDRRAILIVEDDEWWQTILREPLEDEGYDVTVIAGYEEGRQALETRAFDLVILDLELGTSEPILGGERLLAHISQCHPGTPCIVVSGRGSTWFVRDAFKHHHVIDYIPKSRFDISTYINAAKIALQSTVDPAALRRTLEEKFDLEEIQDLCFDLDIDFDALPGEGKKARELIAYCRRRDRLKKLATRIAELRPGAL
ncbi:MAG TPA: response regulator [Anaerolineae bacterium]|nr:response regulator [Anaerolineae bacterium]